MAEKGFGVKEVNLIGASGTPTIISPNNLNLNAVNVAISTNATIGGTLAVTGNVSVGGTLTYEDVTNIDSVGVITARSGVDVDDFVTVGSNIQLGNAGVVTATTFSGSGASLTSIPAGQLTGTVADARISTLTASKLSGALPAISGANLTNLPATDPTDSDIQVVYTVTANGSSAYRFAGNGVVSTADNPDLYLIRGKKYRFINNSGGSHPFQIREASGGTAYSTGVTNNGAASGNIDFAPTYDSPAQLVYQCTSHGGMVGNIYLRDAAGNNTNVGVTTFSGGNVSISSGNLLVGSAAIQYAQAPFYASGTDPVIAAFHHSDGGTNDQARISLGALANNPPYNRGVNLVGLNNGAGHDFVVQCSASHSAGPSEKLRIASDGNLQLNNYSGNAGQGRISFGNSGPAFIEGYDSGNAGSGAYLRFQVNNTEKVRIPRDTWGLLVTNQGSTGNTGGYQTEGVSLRYSGDSTFVKTDAPPVTMTRKGNAGKVLDFYNATTYAGGIYVNGSGNTAIQQTSDYRLKKDISSMTDGITKIKLMNPIYYKNNTGLDTTTIQNGFLAHEIQNVLPTLVDGEKDGNIDETGKGYQTMDYAGLTPTLTAAVKELIAKVETLEAKVATL